MKRRQAIQSLATISMGVVFLPSCEVGSSGPVYSNLPFTNNQRELIGELVDIILPKEDLEVTTPESTLDFVLTMVNDCYAPDDIQKFQAGFSEFETYLDQNYRKNLQKVGPEDQKELLAYLENSEDLSESLDFFYNNTKRLTIQHFTSSNFFMTGYLDFEFVPGRYIGCASV